MKVEMIAVYVIVAALVIVPYIAIVIFGSGKGKKINKHFKNEVKAHNLNITEKESWNRHILGVDKEKQMLIFCQYTNENSVETLFVDLNEITAVDLLLRTNVVKAENKRTEILDSSGLDLHLLHGKQQEICFYDNTIDVAQHYEREHAEKWRALLLSLKKPKPALKNTVAA